VTDRNENRPRYKKTKIGCIPEEWEVKPLGEFGSFSKGKGISNSDKKNSGVACVTYGEIYTRHNFIIKEFYSFIDIETAKKSQRIRKDDILFAGSGETLDDIGKCVAYTKEIEAYAGGDIVIFRPKGVNSTYLSYSLNSNLLIRHKRKLGQGHSVVHIYSSGLKTLYSPLPPLPEQKKIAEILSTWDAALEQTHMLIDARKRRKKALMQQLLTGEIRVIV
jgi:type I restriction enzyme S subunit